MLNKVESADLASYAFKYYAFSA